MKNRLVISSVIIAFLIAVAGCGEGETPQPAANKAKTAKSKKTAQVPAEEEKISRPEIQEYVYNPVGKRDPFENPLKAIVEIAPDSGVPLTPLQKFDLGQMRLIGVIIGRGEPRAMVIAPDGKSFILQVGTKIGKNDGTVTEINTDAVRVKEKYVDFTGDIKTSIQEIRLPKQGGVK